MNRSTIPNNVQNGEGFPQDIAARKLLVQELFDAMINCDKARENMVRLWEGREYRLFADEAPRQMAKIKETPHTLLELMCWQLLRASKDAQEGTVSIAASGQDNLAIRPYPTFRQRFDKVKHTLLNRKAFIDHIMEDQFLWKLAMAPET
ncbi:hypothetical protein BR93DRAFT_941081 [Coniochaeta sp. PMI_546]|nr:hypothetical protein BR93DRAFT_941081 [Coniochaeta sp. PMI_546]